MITISKETGEDMRRITPVFLDKAGAFSYTSTAVKPQSLSIRANGGFVRSALLNPGLGESQCLLMIQNRCFNVIQGGHLWQRSTPFSS